MDHKIDRDEHGNFWTGSAWAAPFHVSECDIRDTPNGPVINQCAAWCPVEITRLEKSASAATAAEAEVDAAIAAEVEAKRVHDEREAYFEAEVNRRIALRDSLRAPSSHPDDKPAASPPPPTLVPTGEEK